MSSLRHLRRSQAKFIGPLADAILDLEMHLAREERRVKMARWSAAAAAVFVAVTLFAQVTL
jgi:hypothetical protein